jgi:hypothetical protein
MRFAALLSTACWVSAASAAFDLNRGGAVLKAPEVDSFATVTGTFTVPNLSGANRLSIWVGIGDTLQQNNVLAGGIVYNSTLQSFSAYFPGPATDTTTAVPVASGNSITVTVSVAAAGGTVTVENTSQNKSTTQTLAAPAGVDPAALTALSANFFVQAYQGLRASWFRHPTLGQYLSLQSRQQQRAARIYESQAQVDTRYRALVDRSITMETPIRRDLIVARCTPRRPSQTRASPSRDRLYGEFQVADVSMESYKRVENIE